MAEKFQATFTWNDPNATTVVATGDFDNWSSSFSLTKTETGFTGTIPVDYGSKHTYKFVVDGRWVVREDERKEDDGKGNINNVFVAPAAAPSAVKAQPEEVEDNVAPVAQGEKAAVLSGAEKEAVDKETAQKEIQEAESKVEKAVKDEHPIPAPSTVAADASPAPVLPVSGSAPTELSGPPELTSKPIADPPAIPSDATETPRPADPVKPLAEQVPEKANTALGAATGVAVASAGALAGAATLVTEKAQPAVSKAAESASSAAAAIPSAEEVKAKVTEAVKPADDKVAAAARQAKDAVNGAPSALKTNGTSAAGGAEGAPSGTPSAAMVAGEAKPEGEHEHSLFEDATAAIGAGLGGAIVAAGAAIQASIGVDPFEKPKTVVEPSIAEIDKAPTLRNGAQETAASSPSGNLLEPGPADLSTAPAVPEKPTPSSAALEATGPSAAEKTAVPALVVAPNAADVSVAPAPAAAESVPPTPAKPAPETPSKHEKGVSFPGGSDSAEPSPSSKHDSGSLRDSVRKKRSRYLPLSLSFSFSLASAATVLALALLVLSLNQSPSPSPLSFPFFSPPTPSSSSSSSGSILNSIFGSMKKFFGSSPKKH